MMNCGLREKFSELQKSSKKKKMSKELLHFRQSRLTLRKEEGANDKRLAEIRLLEKELYQNALQQNFTEFKSLVSILNQKISALDENDQLFDRLLESQLSLFFINLLRDPQLRDNDLNLVTDVLKVMSNLCVSQKSSELIHFGLLEAWDSQLTSSDLNVVANVLWGVNNLMNNKETHRIFQAHQILESIMGKSRLLPSIKFEFSWLISIILDNFDQFSSDI